jgi:dynein heavy chain
VLEDIQKQLEKYLEQKR